MNIDVNKEELDYIIDALQRLYEEHYSYEVEGQNRLEQGERIMALKQRLQKL